jgi:hypothetical protein
MSYVLNELEEKWMAALESGEYRQNHAGKLFDGLGYCCLGVLCAVSGFTPEEQADGFYTVAGGHHALRADIAKRFKLRSGLGDFDEEESIGHTLTRGLAFANDKGATFLEIAAFIRANPEKVFLP